MKKRRSKRQQQIHNLFIATIGLVVFLFLFLGIVIYANWAAVKNEFAYVFNKKPAPVASVKPMPSIAPSATPTPIIEPAHIVIPKIGVDTPLQWDIPANQTLDALNHGVAHLKGSAKLGQIGNLFITGHSSDFSWKKNPYAAVFSLLPKLTTGDTFSIREHGREYVYRITETKIVSPTQVEVAHATTSPVATLMTCYPVGTTRDRFIVHAQLISSPEKVTSSNATGATTLPQIKFR